MSTRSLEAVALVFVFVSFAASVNTIALSKTPANRVSSTEASRVLAWLDAQGYLKKWVYGGDLAKLNSTLYLLLDSPYTLLVYDESGKIIYDFSFGLSDNYASTSYFLSGCNGTLEPRIILLSVGG